MVPHQPAAPTKGKVEILKMRRDPAQRETHFSDTTLAQRTHVGAEG
jgi:hypothetical protein